MNSADRVQLHRATDNALRSPAAIAGETDGATRSLTWEAKTARRKRHYWALAGFLTVVTLLSWLFPIITGSSSLPAWYDVVSFLASNVTGLLLGIAGSLASIKAWMLTSKIADKQDRDLSGVENNFLNSLDGSVSELKANLDVLKTNLDAQANEIQLGRERIETEKRVRSFFRVGVLPHGGPENIVYLYRLEQRVAPYKVPFTPITEDYCVGMIERNLELCRRSANVRFAIRKYSYDNCQHLAASQASTETRYPRLVVYFDALHCQQIEGLTSTDLPIQFRAQGNEVVAVCANRRGEVQRRDDEQPIYKAVIARFKRYRKVADTEASSEAMVGDVYDMIYLVAGLSQEGTHAAGHFLDGIFNLKDSVLASAKISPGYTRGDLCA